MKTTNSAFEPVKSASATVRPSTFGSEKAGAFVPNGSIVLGVKTMVNSPHARANRKTPSYAYLISTLGRAKPPFNSEVPGSPGIDTGR
jgi:hypothetical protein